MIISIYKLGDVDILSNLIGSLSMSTSREVDNRDLKQLGRERQRRRLLSFELSVFPFLVCITRAFLFRFA